MTLSTRISKLNEKIAIAATIVMSTMWCVYSFMIWALLPLLFPKVEPVVFYVSGGVIQLVALPLIMVGQNVLNRKSEERAEEDHRTILAEFKEIKAVHNEIVTTVNEIKALHQELRHLTKAAK
jgi:uncharacterized membrane protein